jgi:hypothetical protein
MKPSLPFGPSLSRAALLLLLAVAGCQRSGEPPPLNEGKRMPKAPPPPDGGIPPELSIAVELNGKPAPPIDARKLESTPPDYVQGPLRAWDIRSLLGPGGKDLLPGTLIAVTGEQGITVDLPIFSGREEVPVLTITRRGELVAALVSRTDPFPAYHGQGGRLERPGDPLPRVGEVTRIRVHVGGSDR